MTTHGLYIKGMRFLILDLVTYEMKKVLINILVKLLSNVY